MEDMEKFFKFLNDRAGAKPFLLPLPELHPAGRGFKVESAFEGWQQVVAAGAARLRRA
jgi:hypothetical protein